MNPWLALTIIAATAATGGIVRALVLRAARRRRPRQVEKPNSHYTPKLVLDRDARYRWHHIPLDRVHEINRDEVRRLLNKVEALGVDGLTMRERSFLERMAELYPPTSMPTLTTADEDPFWADPFGLERRLTRDNS
jgi:hypothetical protein